MRFDTAFRWTMNLDLKLFFFLVPLILYGITGFVLSLALDHQRKYRSTPPQKIDQNDQQGDKEPLTQSIKDFLQQETLWTRFKNSLTVSAILFLILFVIYLVFLLLLEGMWRQSHEEDNVYEILFLSAFALQRIPTMILVILIVLPRNSNDGPTRLSKFYVLVAALLNITGDLPLNVWSRILPGGCLLVVASLLDLIHILYFLSLLFFFLVYTQ